MAVPDSDTGNDFESEYGAERLILYGAALEQGGIFLCGMIRLFAFFSILTTEINDAFVYEY